MNKTIQCVFVIVFLLLPSIVIGQWSPLPDTTLTAPEQHLSERFGESVAISGNVLVIGASQHDEGPVNAGGAAYAYRWSNGNWEFEQELLASDSVDHDQFGNQVAVEDNVIAVGALKDDPFGFGQGFDQGSVTIFRYDGSQWIEEAYLTASNALPGDEFSNEIRLGENGDQLIVGAYAADDFFGRSYIFEYSEGSGSWNQTAVLQPSDVAFIDYSGFTVDISGDFAVVGSPGKDMNVSNRDSGAVYVFQRQGETWTEQVKLEASDWHKFDEFGITAAIHGHTLVVGAHRDGDLGERSGSVYIFQFDGTTWNETNKLIASDGSEYQYFGRSVALDDTTLAVGTYPTLGTPGSVYMFEFQNGNWNEIGKLTTTDNVDDDLFGRPLSVDGNHLATAAPYYDVPFGNAGIAYVFNEAVPFILGDVNGDGSVNLLDVAPFVAALANGEYVAAADINQDGEVNLLDVELFVGLLTSN